MRGFAGDGSPLPTVLNAIPSSAAKNSSSSRVSISPLTFLRTLGSFSSSLLLPGFESLLDLCLGSSLKIRLLKSKLGDFLECLGIPAGGGAPYLSPN